MVGWTCGSDQVLGQICWSDQLFIRLSHVYRSSDHMRSVLQKTFSHVLDHSRSDFYEMVAGPDQLVGSHGVVPVS